MTKTALVAGLCLLVGGVAGASLSSALAAGEPAEEPAPRIRPAVEPVAAVPADYSRYRKLDRFARALAIIEQYYVRPVDGEALIDAALDGLVAELDPHTIYLAPDEAKLLLEDTQGRFGGVGLVVTLRVEPLSGEGEGPDEGGAEAEAEAAPAPTEIDADAEVSAAGEPVRLVMHIDDVIPGGPAEQAGLVVGDRILAIEGKPIANFSDLGDAVTVMRGEPGTKVSFTCIHEDQEPREVTVTRALVDPPAVEVRWLGEGLGVLRLRDFQEASARELRDGLAELEARAKDAGGQLEGVVLDLRDNGGGLLDQAVEIADIFIHDGVILRTRGRQAQLLDEARAHAVGTVRDLPLVVLMNKGSASASEIVAGALQDHGRALIVGERSYGKGSVQAPFELGGGALIKLTTALYYTPDDRLIQASGVEPDVMVGPLLAEYRDSRPTLRPERDNPHHLEPQDFGRPPVPEDDAAPSPARAEAGEDAQLLAAIDHLQAWARVGLSKRARRR
ncbi:putative CtpA-like serine protease [Enhygromyxa salina]|uniref:Putative CtpA-like serine protease n=1 Tax=Enhygromyxa salina TaxID=215803 RepID=A0A2S9XD67_9BACT|nr:S41 family peptidase [Enhygromyxa salina]PRP90710.1 putative CtpA-like serine protease [Enhygromyxa salina]